MYKESLHGSQSNAWKWPLGRTTENQPEVEFSQSSTNGCLKNNRKGIILMADIQRE